MNPRKVFAITVALTKSQLRATRASSASFGFLRRPTSLLALDALLFLGAAGLGYLFVSFASLTSTAVASVATAELEDIMALVPALLPGIVLIAGVIFELNYSSKFSASDTVNWLPVEQSDYVVASALSVAYDYSATLAVALGLTVIPAIALGLGAAWVGMAVLGLVAVFTGGVLVEIVRAAVNRVSSAMMGRARKGAVVLRLLLSVGIIVVVEVVFNPNILLPKLPSFSAGLFPFILIPFFWSALAMEGIFQGDLLSVVGFGLLSLALSGALVWVAVHVRSRYWSPTPTMVRITSSEYTPGSSFLSRLGLSGAEVAIIRKDVKGATRRRELLSFFSVPIAIVAVFTLDLVFTPVASSGAEATSIFVDIPVLFVGGFFGVMVASISFGQESKAVMVLYSLPISPREILRAKAVFALCFALTATVATGVYFGVLAHMDVWHFLENLTIGVAIAVEEVCVGLGFGASHPDFQERPRPRYVDPVWQLVMILLVAFPVMGVTAIPLLVRNVAGTIPGLSPELGYFFLAALVFAGAISVLFYRWAVRGVQTLMSEYRI